MPKAKSFLAYEGRRTYIYIYLIWVFIRCIYISNLLPLALVIFDLALKNQVKKSIFIDCLENVLKMIENYVKFKLCRVCQHITLHLKKQRDE